MILNFNCVVVPPHCLQRLHCQLAAVMTKRHTVNDKSFTVKKLSRIFSKLRKLSQLNFCSAESQYHESF